MSDMRVFGFGDSDTGRIRKENEDSFLVDNEKGLFVIGDGMGGHNAGEVASREAVKAVQTIVGKNWDLVEELSRFGVADSDIIRFMEDLILGVCEKVKRIADTRAEYYKMGTTLTVLINLNGRAVMGHVGDSRLYMVRNENAFQLSDDHTYSNELVRSGAMSPEKAQKSKYRHAVTQSVGTEDVVLVDTLLFDLMPGDLLILCSDGLSDYLTDPEDIEELVDPDDPQSSVGDLIQWANSRGGADNITVIAIGVEAQEAPEQVRPRIEPEKMVTAESLMLIPLFEDLPLKDLLRLVNIAEIEEVSEGELLLDKGEPCLDYTYVISGRLKGVRENSTEIILKTGDTFGHEAFSGDSRGISRIEVIEDAVLLMFPFKLLDRLMRRRPRLGLKIYRHLADELVSLVGRQ